MVALPTNPKTGSAEPKPDEVDGISCLSISPVDYNENPSWEAVERMKDECDANEKLLKEALLEGKYLKAAEYHLNTIGLKERLSPRYRFLKMARINAYIKQLEILLRCAEPLSQLEALLPSHWEDLRQGNSEPFEGEEYGKLYALLGSLYMRSDDRQGWRLAEEHLDRALRYLVQVSPQPIPFITQTTQNLVDMHDLLGEHAAAEGRLKWLKRKILPELTTEIKIGRISDAKLWCQEKGFSVRRFDEVDSSRNLSPLALAVKEKRHGEVDAMLSFTAETSPPNDLASELLLLAADTRSSEVARLLLARGARVIIKDGTGKTVLHRCQYCPELGNQGGLKIANLFLDAYGDLLDQQDKSGKTALYMACESGHFDMADLLLKRGANPNILEANGKTALYMACERGQLNIVQRLLKQTADPNIEGPGKYTPLMIAVMMASKKVEKDRLEVVKELVKFRADPRKADHKGHDAFHHIGGPLAPELKHVLKRYLQADPLSARKSMEVPTEVSVSESGSGSKTRNWLFNSSFSEHRSRSSKSRLPGSNATSSSKSTRDSIFSSRTGITNPTIPNSDTNTDDIIAAADSLRGFSKGLDPRGTAVNLPPILESLPPNQPDAVRGAPGSRDVEPGPPAAAPGDGATNPRPRLLAEDRDNTPLYSDGSRSRGTASLSERLRESISVTDTSSVFSYSEADSEVTSERRDASRQNLPLTLNELFPFAAYQFNRQHAGDYGTHVPASGAHGWGSKRGSGSGGQGGGGSFPTTPNNHNQFPGDSDRNGDSPESIEVNGDGAGQDSALLFACPFAKAYTARYFNCNFHKLVRIKDIKQHLERKHKQPPHCPRCRMQFSNTGDRDQHIRDVDCRRSNQTEPEGITSDQTTQLKRRVNARLTPFDQWYEVFYIVFPNWDPRARPASPYVQRDFGLFDFADQHGRPIVREYLQHRDCPRNDEAFETLILIGVQRVIQAFLVGRSPIPMPGFDEDTPSSGATVENHSATPRPSGDDSMNIEHRDDSMISSQPQRMEDASRWPNTTPGPEESTLDHPGQRPPTLYPDTPTFQPQGLSECGSMNWNPESWYSNQHHLSPRDSSYPDRE